MVTFRSSLAAGIAASLLAAGAGVAAVTPVAATPLPVMASPAVQLSALVAALPKPALPQPALPKPAAARPTMPSTGPFGGAPAATPGQRIINGYNAAQPWVQYGVDLSAWGVGFLPWPVNLLAPQMTIGYSGVSPLSQAAVYSVAYAIDGQWDLIGPTVQNGVQTSVSNVIQGEIGWIRSYFPPLPPIGGASVVAPKAPARTAAATAASAVAAVAAVAATPSIAAPAVHSGKPVQRISLPAPAAAAGGTGATADPGSDPAPKRRSHTGARSTTKSSPGSASSVKAGRTGR